MVRSYLGGCTLFGWLGLILGGFCIVLLVVGNFDSYALLGGLGGIWVF